MLCPPEIPYQIICRLGDSQTMLKHDMGSHGLHKLCGKEVVELPRPSACLPA